MKTRTSVKIDLILGGLAAWISGVLVFPFILDPNWLDGILILGNAIMAVLNFRDVLRNF